jgi:hypothetical protein
LRRKSTLCGRLPVGKGFFRRLCNAGWCGHVSDLLVRHIAPLVVMPSAYQVPTKSSHSRCWVELGSPDPAVSTDLLHQLPIALSNLFSATVVAPYSMPPLALPAGRFADRDSAHHWT